MRYARPESLLDAAVTVDDDRVTDLTAAEMIFNETEVELGDLRPGDPCMIMFRIDGTLGRYRLSSR